MSVILPASNEEALIGACLRSVLISEWAHDATPEVIVIANGCTDQTAQVASKLIPEFCARGWELTVIEQETGGKLGALNTGDAAANSGIRVYLDADVTMQPALLSQLYSVLNTPAPRYASGRVNMSPAHTWVSRAYRRIYSRVPFMTTGVPGCGLFAVNEAGRKRWDTFPDIISDDTFVRLSFTPDERIGVSASYDWPIVEGLGNLIKVRRRQNRGVDEISQLYPHLLQNDDERPFPLSQKLGMALRDPIGFAVYSGVALIVKLSPGQSNDWSRGR